MKLTIYLPALVILLLSSCKKNKTPANPLGNNSPDPRSQLSWLPSDTAVVNGWSIPWQRVLDGGPGKDGIPSIDNPQFIVANAAAYLNDDDLVLGYKSGSVTKAYPHKILDYHEIINDVVNAEKIAVTYCPLTGTGVGWNRIVNGVETTFGVSGLLFNTNLIPYDRHTQSNYSQMLARSVNGTEVNKKLNTVQLVETTWRTWRSWYPDTKVLSDNTGFNRNYQVYPYRDYKTDNDFVLFPTIPDDIRLPRKKRVLCIIRNYLAKAYTFDQIDNSGGFIQDFFENRKFVIVGDKMKNFLVAFESTLPDGTPGLFTEIKDNSPVVLRDQFGNKYDVFGVAVSGPWIGQKLKQPFSFIGYWLAWNMYPYPEVY